MCCTTLPNKVCDQSRATKQHIRVIITFARYVRAFIWHFADAYGLAGERLQNFLFHIRKLPHFDTRFGVVLERCRPPQKSRFYKCPGKCVAVILRSEHMCLEGPFSASKRVSKWGNFLISLTKSVSTAFTCNSSFIWLCMELSCRFSLQDAIKTCLEQLYKPFSLIY